MKQMEQALKQLTGEPAVIKPFSAKDRLSLYLAASYEFFLATILDTTFLLVSPTEKHTVPQIKVHFQKLKETFGYEVVLFSEQLTPYKKNRLIKERLAFVCSDKQIFLPFMCVNLHNKPSKAVHKMPEETFTASMQLIFLFILYGKDSLITQEELSRRLGISSMTASRTLEKFVQLKLLDCSVGGKTGRKKIYLCNDKKAFYQLGKPCLIDPVLERFFVRQVPGNIKKYVSGLSALSERTLLAPPNNPVIAISRQDKAKLSPYLVPWEAALEKHFTEVNVIKYDVGLLTEDDFVDMITMIYSIKKPDERIEIAIEEVMEGYSWYEG